MSERIFRQGDGTWAVRVTVVSQEDGDDGPIDFGATYKDGTLQGVIDSLLNVRDMVPEAYRSTARCQIESVSGYEDSHYARVSVEYTRPATTEETAAAQRAEAARAAARQRQELAMLASLKARYEGA